MYLQADGLLSPATVAGAQWTSYVFDKCVWSCVVVV